MASNWKNFDFIDLFAGIGGIRIPFEELGGECVFTSEWDKDCQTMYEANFGHRPAGDITKINPLEIPAHDILLGGFPCQAFSIIGQKKGFEDTRGTLFFNIAKILEAKQPRAFLLENVKQLKSHDKGRTYEVIENTLKELGYKVQVKVLNALDYGLPQKRERTIIVGFKDDVDFSWPTPNKTKADLNDFLDVENDKDKSLQASQYIIERRLQRLKEDGKEKPFYPSMWHENKSGNISVLPYSVTLRAGASHNYLLVNGKRRLSSRELLRFQGFPENFKLAVKHSAIRKQAGNSVPVPLIRAVAIQMMKALRTHAENNKSVMVPKRRQVNELTV
jgi:DNA (cytosine-5)-methyltransferase 1